MNTEQKCASCGTGIPVGRITCGRACSARHNSSMTAHLRRSRRRCSLCDRPTETGLELCRKHEMDRRINLGQVSNPPTLRAWLIRERGRRCEKCNNIHWLDGPIPLELDHISGDSGDNNPSNIRLLCPNCHSLTLTYKARNKGRGRAARRIKASLAQR